MIVLTESQVLEMYRVSAAELARASRTIDMKDGSIFYIVSSRSGGDDHKVTTNKTGRRLSCTCAAGRDGLSCWAMRASMASSRLYLQAENEQARAEAQQAAIDAERARVAAQDAAAARQLLSLNGNGGFSLLKQSARSMRGVDIRYRVAGDGPTYRKLHAWSNVDELPAEWAAIIADPTTLEAHCFPSSQVNWKAAKRRTLATFTAREVVTA